MPRAIRYRKYCKCCENFTLFQAPTDITTYICTTCDTEYSTVFLKDIDPKKIDEQRTRFKQKRSESMQKILNTYLTSGLNAFYDNDSNIGLEVHESDAGLLSIEKELKEKKQREKQQYDAERAELGLLFKNVQRNEPCRCGSGIKYKKCCINKILKYHL